MGSCRIISLHLFNPDPLMSVHMPNALTPAPADWANLISQQRWKELQSVLEDTHVSDIAEMLATLPQKERAIVFRLVGRDRASEVFGYLPPADQSQLIHS